MFQRRTGPWSILALLVVLSLLVTACQGGQQGNTTASATGAIDPNGELTTNTGGEPDTIDPQKESFVAEVGQTMMVFEALMNLDPKTLRPVPAAAIKDPEVSADGLTYKYTLRDGLKYSDGSAVTPKDFAFGFTRLCDPVTAGEYAFTGYVIVGCEDWNGMDPKKATPAEMSAAKAKLGIKTDDKSITFTLTESAPYFNSIAALWVGVPSRESDVTKGGDKWTEPATFIGNGPFKLTEWKHNEKLVYERNDNYRTPAKLKKWTRVMINEGAVAFAAGGTRPPLDPWGRLRRASYAEQGEDLILAKMVERLRIERPTFIDIGAYHPVDANNTYLLYERGIRGANAGRVDVGEGGREGGVTREADAGVAEPAGAGGDHREAARRRHDVDLGGGRRRACGCGANNGNDCDSAKRSHKDVVRGQRGFTRISIDLRGLLHKRYDRRRRRHRLFQQNGGEYLSVEAKLAAPGPDILPSIRKDPR